MNKNTTSAKCWDGKHARCSGTVHVYTWVGNPSPCDCSCHGAGR